jgi:hypothetical protein
MRHIARGVGFLFKVVTAGFLFGFSWAAGMDLWWSL